MPYISEWYLKFDRLFSRCLPAAYRLCQRRKGLIKFVLAGLTAGIIDLVLLYIFHNLLDWDIVVATSVAFIIAFLVSFTLQKFWTFRDYRQDKLASQLFLYLLNALIGLSLNGYFMHLFVNEYRIQYLVAQIVVNGLVASQNFVVYKFIVFKKDRHEIISQ